MYVHRGKISLFDCLDLGQCNHLLRCAKGSMNRLEYLNKGSHLCYETSVEYLNKKEDQTQPLTCAAMLTHLDITYITQFLTKTNKAPSIHDWNVGKHVLQYIRSMKSPGIICQQGQETGGVEQDHTPLCDFYKSKHVKDECGCKRSLEVRSWNQQAGHDHLTMWDNTNYEEVPNTYTLMLSWIQLLYQELCHLNAIVDWMGKYYYPVVLMFGEKSAPYIFNLFMEA